MTKKRSQVFSEEMLDVLEELPIPDDEQMSFFSLRSKFILAVEPRDFVEGVWVHDFAYYTAEIIRLRGFRASFIRMEQQRIIIVALKSLVEGGAIKPEANILELTEQYIEFKEIRPTLEKLLPVGFSFETVTAKAFCNRLNEHRHIEEMLTSIEAKRFALLREIEHRQTSFARQLRDAETDIIAAKNGGTLEFKVEDAPSRETVGKQYQSTSVEMERSDAIATKIQNGSPLNPSGVQDQTDIVIASNGEAPLAPQSSTPSTPEEANANNQTTSRYDDLSDPTRS